jgi:hypothetical protein
MSLHGLEVTITRVRGKLLSFVKNENGSISILTIGLFTILLATALVLSDISSVYLAKRTLILASEAAVQRGSKNLDQSAYYSGEYNSSKLLEGVIGLGDEDPGIPIDCQAGVRDAQELLANWQGRDATLTRASINGMQLTQFQCDGFQIYLESVATVKLPFPLAFIGISDVTIRGSAGGIGERSETNNYYGVDIG